MHQDIFASAKPDLMASIEGLRWQPVLCEIITKNEKAVYWKCFKTKEQALLVAENHLRICRDEEHQSLLFHGHWIEPESVNSKS